jgi:RND family efflux transporter MFP subunit
MNGKQTEKAGWIVAGALFLALFGVVLVNPMHLAYRSGKPGIGPDPVPAPRLSPGALSEVEWAGLVPIYAPEGAASGAPTAGAPAAPGERGPVEISTAQGHLIGLTTARAEYRRLEKTLRAVARVDVDETRIGQVHTRITGWVQKVYVDYTSQEVRKGDPLFTIYSPDLVATEQEYLLALKGQRELGGSPFPDVAVGANSLLEAARQRLAQWDVSAEQISEIEKTRQVKREITIFSPLTGVVTERKVFPNQYVTPDMSLYTIVDYTHAWVYADVYESEIPYVRLGQAARFTTLAYPGQVFSGRIDYLWPQMDATTRTLKVRIDFPNPGLKLKPEMYGNVEIRMPLGRRLAVPDPAVLDSGLRQMVFVEKAPGILEPRSVQVGARTDGYVEIVEGLKAGETVASSANFLIDSESQLRAALAGMTLGTGVTGIGGQVAPTPRGEVSQAAGSVRRLTDRLQISFHTQPEPARAGKNRVLLSVRDAAGQPVENAQVKVVFFMPPMPSMNMPATRSEALVGFLGAGMYGGEIQVPTPGTWQATVEVQKEGKVLGGGQFTVTAE